MCYALVELPPPRSLFLQEVLPVGEKENKIFMRSFTRSFVRGLRVNSRHIFAAADVAAASFTHARASFGGNIWNGMSKGGARGGEGEGACAEEK